MPLDLTTAGAFWFKFFDERNLFIAIFYE